MHRHAVVSVPALCWLMVSTLAAQTPAPSTMVDVGGHKLNVRVGGTATPGVPTIVLVSGLGSPLELWTAVQSTMSASTRTIAYDRSGVGKSEPGTETPTSKYIVGELHALLDKLGAAPPYVLVGHSWGGPIIHTFAGTFPKDVAGLVYVDPTDFTQTEADMMAVWEKAGVKNGHDIMEKALQQLPAAAPPGILTEGREIVRLERGGFAELRESGEPPDVPTVILLAGKRPPQPTGTPFLGDFERYFEATLEQRVDHFARLAQRARFGTMIMTSKSGHFIQLSEPELVQWGIVRVMSLASSSTPGVVASGSTSSARALPGRSGPEDSVRSLDSGWARAYATHDTAFARALFADDLAVTNSAGQLHDRERELADVRPITGLQMEYFRTEDVVCRVHEGTAIVTGLAVWRLTMNGQPSSLRKRYTATYARGGQLGWRLVALQLGSAPG